MTDTPDEQTCQAIAELWDEAPRSVQRPTAAQMAQLKRLEADLRRAQTNASTEMVLQVKRRPKPDARSLRIAPGLTGRLVQWGDGTWLMPSVVFVKTADMERFIARCREQLDAAPADDATSEEG